MARTVVRGVTALLVVALLGVAAVWGVLTYLRSLDAEPRALERCTAVNDGVRHPLTHEQADTAALLAATVLRRGMPARATTIAIATAMQESSLRNIDYGDRDSLGLFQQRPSQGWGTPEEIMDPVYATHTFLDALDEVAGYESMEVTVAAQSVQRSAFPDAYAQHEPMSRAWASALMGHSPGAVTCVAHEHAPGDVDTLLARIDRDLGAVAARVVTGDRASRDAVVVELDAAELAGRSTEGAPRLAWALAQWAVAVAPGMGIAEASVAEQRWTTESATWATTTATPVTAGRVLLTLHP